LIDSDVPIHIISLLMGHAKLETTKDYFKYDWNSLHRKWQDAYVE